MDGPAMPSPARGEGAVSRGLSAAIEACDYNSAVVVSAPSPVAGEGVQDRAAYSLG